MHDREYRHEPSGHGPNTAPLLAKSTASVELASGVEKVTAGRPEALKPGTYGEVRYSHKTPPQSKAGCEVETLLRQGKRVHELSPGILSRKRERA